MTDLCCKTLF